MKLKLTARCARITHERAVRLVAMIEQLRKGQMMRPEIESLVALSPGGLQKYMEDLIDNKIMLRVRYEGETVSTPRLYRITEDSERVAEFMRQITAPGLDGLPRHRGRNISPEDTNRRVHIAKDDEPIKVKLSNGRPPKQTDLLLHLFGLVPQGVV